MRNAEESPTRIIQLEVAVLMSRAKAVTMPFLRAMSQAAGLLATGVVLTLTSPFLLALFLPLGIVYGKLQRYYRSTSRELRRLDSTSR